MGRRFRSPVLKPIYIPYVPTLMTKTGRLLTPSESLYFTPYLLLNWHPLTAQTREQYSEPGPVTLAPILSTLASSCLRTVRVSTMESPSVPLPVRL